MARCVNAPEAAALDLGDARAVAGLLIRMRRQELRHGVERMPRWASRVLAAIAAVSLAATVLVAALPYGRPGAGANVVAFVLALWCVGRIASAAVSGHGMPAPELFRALPLPGRTMGRAFLLAGLADPGLWFCGLAFLGSLAALGIRGDGAAGLAVGVLAAAALTALVGVASTVVAGSLTPGSGRGRDASTLVIALAIAAVGTAGAAGPILASALTDGRAPALQAVVRWLPSGWGAVAVDAVSPDGAWLVAVALAGLVAATAGLVGVWPRLLARRMDERNAPVLRARPVRLGRFPAGPVGAVATKELRLWTREQLRLILVVVAVFFGLWPCVISGVNGGKVLLPFGGALTLVFAAACAVNLYGGDGRSFWCIAATPRAPRPDVLGRQLGWLILFGPYAMVLTLALTALSGQVWAWPWVLSGLPALLGGGAALAVLGSLIVVLPLADDAGPTPAWSAKVHVALPVAVLPAIPPAAIVGLGTAWHMAPLRWAAIPVGLATGAALLLGSGHLATNRLAREQVDILACVGAHPPA